MKRIFISLLFLCILAGCRSGSDYIEPESRIIVSALGVDSSEEGLLVTAECININTTNNNDSYDIKIITGEGSNMQTATAALSTKIDGELLLSQCPVFLLGDSLTNENLSDIYAFAIDTESIPFGIRLVSCVSANSLINANVDKKPSGYQIMSMLRFGENSVGITGGDSFVKVINSKQNMLYKMPYVDFVGSYQVSGTHYFTNEYHGKLDILQAQILYLLCDDLQPCEVSVGKNMLNFKSSTVKENNNGLNIKIVVKDIEKINSMAEVTENLKTEIFKVLSIFNYQRPVYVNVLGEA